MKEKRYVIVRVDDRCPVEEEEDIYLVDRIKMFPCFNDKRLSCKKCKYGDTKEQLVLKITQVLKIKRALFGITDKQLAKEIVEFLGVEGRK